MHNIRYQRTSSSCFTYKFSMFIKTYRRHEAEWYMGKRVVDLRSRKRHQGWSRENCKTFWVARSRYILIVWGCFFKFEYNFCFFFCKFGSLDWTFLSFGSRQPQQKEPFMKSRISMYVHVKVNSCGISSESIPYIYFLCKMLYGGEVKKRLLWYAPTFNQKTHVPRY